VPTPYDLAMERYAALGVDTEQAILELSGVPISLHCWQGDDVAGFEAGAGPLGGGLAVTGDYPGKARTPDELRQDLSKALDLIPGKHRLNLHAMYGEFGGAKVDRDAIEPAHFQGWIEWCRANDLGFDFNPTCFSHPLAASGFTLSHANEDVRDFWIEHCRRCREIGAHAASALDSQSIVNVWVPDGMKDTPADRRGPRERLCESLDAVFEEPYDNVLDAVESKLFGIGSESYVAGSHEFYLSYAVSRGKLLCLDTGHFHPTESVADKVSACMTFLDELFLHVSRGLHWDSDHVVVLNDDLLALSREVVANGYLDRVHFGLDFFDASINRVAAWVVGARALQQALLIALLEPTDTLRSLESTADFTSRLAMQEHLKSLPWGSVWDELCSRLGVADDWMSDIKQYEASVLSLR
jgi:L-rhamnose isomerase